MQILILTRKPELHAIRRLAEECRKKGHNPVIFDPEHPDILKERPDRVLARFGSYRFEDSLRTLEFFERRGIPCLNGTTAYRDSRNKWICALHLQDHDLPVPATTLADKSARPARFPVVLKPLEGSQGVGVRLIRNLEEWMALPSELEWVQQEFVAESEGRDLRAFVVGGRLLGAIERLAAPGEFRANLHLGGSAQPVALTETEIRYSLTATKALKLDVAGVDLIRSNRGPLVLEVNPCPGFEGFEKATRLNAADPMIEFLLAKGR